MSLIDLFRRPARPASREEVERLWRTDGAQVAYRAALLHQDAQAEIERAMVAQGIGYDELAAKLGGHPALLRQHVLGLRFRRPLDLNALAAIGYHLGIRWGLLATADLPDGRFDEGDAA